ncbi:polysaccharide pyruvyl transferase family protein [Planctomycetota bacterium]
MSARQMDARIFGICKQVKNTAIYRSAKYLWDVLCNEHPRIIYVSGDPGGCNLGDRTLFNASRRLFNRCNFVHYPGGRAVSIPSKLLGISGLAMLAGGTLINRLSLSEARQYVELFPRFFVFGTGVAQSYFWSRVPGWRETLQEWKPILDRCEYVGVRGPLSAHSLTELGISGVEVIGDPVLAYANDINMGNGSYLPKSIGLNVGQSYEKVWGSEESICSEFAKLAVIARRERWTVKWFVVWPEDLRITEKAARLSGTEQYIYRIYSDYDKYLQLVKPLSTFVGMKLHSVILATCVSVPSIMLEYRPKCRDYMMSIGQEHNTIRTDKFKAEEVWGVVCEWNSIRTSVSNRLYECIRPLRERQRKRAEELMRVFEGR